METTSARRLAELVGDLGDARPPRYAALAGRVRLLVADGRVPLGTRLPAERDLATALALSRATVTAAYARLREDGWATARQGAGTFAALPAGPHRGAWVPGPVDDGTIDMAHAAPSAPSSVPAAFATALAELPRYLPQHGYHPAGLPDLRARIAERYTARALPTTPEQVLVTAGALHGVSTAFQTVLRRGQRLLVEQPTYPNALDAARAVGARLLPTALDADRPGDWLEAAERALRTRPAVRGLPDAGLPQPDRPAARHGRRASSSPAHCAGPARPPSSTRRSPSCGWTRRHRRRWPRSATGTCPWAASARRRGAGCGSAGCGPTPRRCSG